MRPVLLALALAGLAGSANAQISVGVGLPSVSIGINLGGYPDLVEVPGYPVYYAPRQNSNLFFYDGMYWAYARDRWYSSAWYNGPWDSVDPQYVPLYVLRVPVRYYRAPPAYFGGWAEEQPPRWGEHWGQDWERQRNGWNRWDRQNAPRPAPLPTYQREYSGNRYPDASQQRALHEQNYHYQPRDSAVGHQQEQQRGRPAEQEPQRGRQEQRPQQEQNRDSHEERGREERGR